jgi:CRISPR-associated protein Csd1
MSWIEELYRTYGNNSSHIGDPNDKMPLLPMFHTIQNAHIEITIDNNGNFLRAKIVDKSDSPTIIPATEESAGRTGSRPINHPLCDKLQYVAGDYQIFGGEVTSGYAKEPQKPHEMYLKSLRDWCSSPYSNPKALAVYDYIKKGHVMADLIKSTILPIDNEGKLLKMRPPRGKGTSEIFRVLPASSLPEDAFVRWIVEIPGDLQPKLWRDHSMWQSWENYCITQESNNGLCYVTGEKRSLAINHPKRIRHSADGAKLISSNDNEGYTFRGRFITANEACGLSLEVTQKAHNALRWLIARQGWRREEQAIVAWAVSGKGIPDPLKDTASLFSTGVENSNKDDLGYTAQGISLQLNKLIAGYSVKLNSMEDVCIIVLDSAVPGRMAISYYRELTGSDYLERILEWHRDCSWLQEFSKDKIFIGAPSPRDVAEAAYGSRLDKKLEKATIERLLSCIIEGVPIYRDLVESCVRRASNRNAVKEWEWNKNLGIACALFKYQNKERRYTVALETERNTRDYLYGRLLAIAERIEEYALYLAGENRETTAARLMQRFAQRPYSTWQIIETSLIPYKGRLRARRPGFLHNMESELDDVFNVFAKEEFSSDRSLSGEFLLGYHCQRANLRHESIQEKPNKDEIEK